MFAIPQLPTSRSQNVRAKRVGAGGPAERRASVVQPSSDCDVPPSVGHWDRETWLETALLLAKHVHPKCSCSVNHVNLHFQTATVPVLQE